jgi:hypothetical protein
MGVLLLRLGLDLDVRRDRLRAAFDVVWRGMVV